MNPCAGKPIIAFRPIQMLAAPGCSAPIAMEDQTVHVWGFSLEGSRSFVGQCRSWLSEDERRQADRFICQEDQRRYVLAHGGLRAVLGRYIGLDPSAVMFQLGPTGKPALLTGHAPQFPVRFNLSHSHGRMLIAIAGERDIGVDLEQIQDRAEAAKLAKRFYAPDEYERVVARSGSEQTQWFFHYWVAKEAALKGQGIGLRSLQQCEILQSVDSPRAEVMILRGASMQPGWTIHWLDCGTGWAGAVSAHGANWNVRSMTND